MDVVKLGIHERVLDVNFECVEVVVKISMEEFLDEV